MITSAAQMAKTKGLITDYMARFPLYNARVPSIRYFASGSDDFKIENIIKALNEEPVKVSTWIYGIKNSTPESPRPLFRVNKAWAKLKDDIIAGIPKGVLDNPEFKDYEVVEISESGQTDRIEIGINYDLRKEHLPGIIKLLKEILCAG